ncbi:Astacin-like metalloendopeptidase [Strongyloides ratti]|uniref:Metalloendopeptidase n=1 Tax=Strongyloides ratti TaxID=34506 RepID=A0A090KS24_STRRB|nr:Astacin-like metalloendopeptidase [Strongyloides ratti]CEF60175.2 Astacin-like metalloendopeptidase [Strongyloides ratti]
MWVYVSRNIYKILYIFLIIFNYLLYKGDGQLSSIYHYTIPEEVKTHHSKWMESGKFQGDIIGVNEDILHSSKDAMHNALKNKQLIWPNGKVPYVLDEAFTSSEVNELLKSFYTYKKLTCIRFVKRTNEKDYLNIIKGYGCYSQVGRTGGKQEISLGRGCLFHEIIIHELMHSLGFWHEHSRFDRNDHIKIIWDNILPGMKSQFDIISPALQDTQGEPYDYKSIMHYDSTAFSKNGKNTIETTVEGFTDIIGSSVMFSKLDIIKINKLYKCHIEKSNEDTKESKENDIKNKNSNEKDVLKNKKTIYENSNEKEEIEISTVSPTCQDHFIDCPVFKSYCKRPSFYYVMKSYCPFTCNHCR